MNKIMMLILATFVVLSLDACDTVSEDSINITAESVVKESSEEQESAVDEISTQETSIAVTEPVLDYFEEDVVVNDFFTNYNAIAENIINPELIEKGNVKSKALVYADSFSLEVINSGNKSLSITIETMPEHEETTMQKVFCDCIKVITDMTDDEIVNAWNDIHESGYMVENYELNGVIVAYVPSKELSWGVSNPRVDLAIPLE